MRVSVELLPDASADEVLSAIDVADASAIDTVFCVDEVYHRDAWGLLAAAAQRTRRVQLGPGVAHVRLRDPLLVAQQLATLDELSQGRAIAAISVGNLAMLEQFGIDSAGLRVARRVREAHAAIRALLDTGSVDLEGELLRYRGVFTTARPVASRVPLLIGAMGGPLTFQLAGEIADGVYAACSFSREALEYVLKNVRVGAERAGRDYRDLETYASVTAAVAEDGHAAREAARLKAAFYLPSMPRALVERHGIPFAAVEPINAAFARGDIERALSLTTDEIGDRLSIAGTPEEVAERVRTDIFDAGFTHAVLALADREIPRLWAGTEIPGLPTLSEQVRLIAERVLPLITARSKPTAPP
ncbi:MAG TPA: LLM class flavin-dependent oxidoreductase [Kineosporiaceae bacterium]|nr:LLM class flavin-dependent oxidoreductase [Kineosporiaceae bacterium]